jgi:hypothetical protein
VEVDVQTAIEIERERAIVAAYASDLDKSTIWYNNIKRVEWRSSKPLRVGSRIAFIARFLGRTIDYTYKVKEFVPGVRLVMAASEGPFAMETTYSWHDTPNGGTKMTLRNRGAPSGFSKVAAPMMKAAIRRANSKDLARLKQILESDSGEA